MSKAGQTQGSQTKLPSNPALCRRGPSCRHTMTRVILLYSQPMERFERSSQCAKSYFEMDLSVLYAFPLKQMLKTAMHDKGVLGLHRAIAATIDI